MADLVLKDRDGTAITYNGVEVVSVPNTDGGLDHFLNLKTGGIPSGGTDGQVLKKKTNTDYDVNWENEVDITGKADKVTGGTADNFASLDANGNLKDSGKKATDFEPKDATILKKAQVVNDLTTGGTDVPLSAEQGKLIKQEVDVLQSDVSTAQVDITTAKKQVQDLTQAIQQSNLSGEDKIYTEGYGTLGLPKNATGYCGVELNGNTLRNLVVNGDFSNGTTGWSSNAATISTQDGIGQWTWDGVDPSPNVTKSVPTYIKGHKYYTRAKARVLNNNAATITLSLLTDIAKSIKIQSLPIQNKWYILSGVHTVSETSTLNRISVYTTFDIPSTPAMVSQIDDVTLIDLTAHGLDTLTVEQCDLMTDLYFSGTQSAMVSRVTSVGKNLLNLNGWEQGTFNLTDGKLSTSTTRLRQKTRLKSNTFYIRTDGNRYFRNLALYDVSGGYLGTSTTQSFLTPNNCAYSVIVYSLTSTGTENIVPMDMLNSNIQLEEGTTATPYEPYRKQEQYIKPYPLYRLPNGTCNDIVDGKYTGRVKKYVPTANDVVGLSTDTNIDYVLISKPTDYIGYGNTLIAHTTIYVPNYTSSNVYNTVESINNISAKNINDRFVIGIIKGSHTLATAKTALAGTVIYYELAPQYYEYDYNIATGLLNANPNGTIYFDNGFADAGIYNDGITILNQDYPIEELETLLILNNDGSHTRLDPSTATVALDGKSFTHAGLTNGDVVAFTYKGADSPLKGKNKITYLDSKNTIADTANGKFYKYKPVVTNGVIASWALEEV